uniref:Putative ribonuclease H-like domain-containing protein n=1 Tax=Tanacetum cinerariifolium TaxID=118510 RepID=A0A6L2NFC9_TANCI|nr:putative ribonuclease H-like domain-containing protein [Tanacetum cinerariifolium]
MIAILEKYEQNVNFHQIVDFVEASHIRYALTINPTVYVSYIRQFWSTARIETTNAKTKILATVDGKPITIFESSIRRNLKLHDEAGISSLPDAELFENLTLKGTVPLFATMLVPQGEGSGASTKPHHTPPTEAQQSSHNSPSSPIHPTEPTKTIPPLIPTDTPSLRQYTRRAKRIGQSPALPTVTNEPTSPFRDDSQGEALPTVSGLEAGQDRDNITKTSALPHKSTSRVTSFATDEGSMQHQIQELTDLCTSLQRQQTKMATKIAAQDLGIANLKARIKLLEDKDGRGVVPSGEDAPIKRRSLETEEEAGGRSDDTQDMVIVLTSMDAASILTSGVQVVSVPPAAEFSTVGIPIGSGSVPTASPIFPTGSDMVPTASLIFTTASVVTPYSRCKGKEKMVESDTPNKKKLQEQIDVQLEREMEEQIAIEDRRRSKQIARDAEIARIHADEELQMMIDGLDRNNKVIAKHLHEYDQAAVDLSIREKIELINELVKYQDHHTKTLKYQAQQSKPLSKKQQKEFYMSVIKSHSGWKTKHFKGMSFEEIREKFTTVWKKIEDFVPMGSKEEAERLKRKGLRLEQEDLNQLWALVKETLSTRHATSDKEKELWVELKRLYELDVKDQLWIHTQAMMHALGRIVGNKMIKAFPLPVKKFPLPDVTITLSNKVEDLIFWEQQVVSEPRGSRSRIYKEITCSCFHGFIDKDLINLVIPDVRRDNALVALRQKFEKAEQERDELKLKLEKFQTFLKNLSQLLVSQTNDKTGLGYDNQVFTSYMFACDEMFSSKSDVSMPASPIYDRYQSRDGYHDVSPPYTGTFIPPEPDLVFHDALTVNETVHTAFNVELSPTKPKKDLSHTHRPSAPIIKDWVSDSEDESKAEPTQNAFILTRSKLVLLTAARPVTPTVSQNNVTRTRPAKTVITEPHSPPRRNINRRTSPKPSTFPLKVTTVKAPKINDVKGNPQHALKDKGVINSRCSRHMTRNMSYLTDFKEINGGYVAFGGNPKGGKITGKFDRKADEGFLVGYSENKPNVARNGPTWLFDIDTLTKSINYQPVTARNQPNPSAGIQEQFDTEKVGEETVQQYVLFPLCSSGSKDPQNTDSDATFEVKKPESKVHVSPSSSAKTKKLDDKTKREAKGKTLEDITYPNDEEDVDTEADFSNLETTITVSPILTTRFHKDHPVTQIIGDLSSATQTRSMTRIVKDQGRLTQINNEDFHTCMFACFLSQEEPKREEGIDYAEVFAPVARIKAIRLFLAYASFMGFMVYQMDIKSAFLYGTIEEEVYVCQPPGFEDPDYPDKVYKVVKELYGLHQAPRAWYETLATYLLENGFQRGKIDQTLFIKKQKDGKSASIPIDTEKPLLKDPDGEDVDVHTYRYLKGKPHLGLWYPKDSPFNLVAYSDSDYAGASLDRKYTTRGCQFLGCRLIYWQCKKQTVVATSSTEAEYVAAASCYAQEVDVAKDAEVEKNADVQRRQEESQAKVYHIDLEHADKVLSMQDDEPEPDELQKVIEVVTTAKLMTKVVTATAPITAALSVAKRRKEVMIRDPEKTTTPSTIIHSKPKSKDKGKGIMVQEPKPLKKQAQIEQDEAYARELEAELNKNINWDNVIEQVKEKGKQDNAMLRYQALKRKPQTEAQAKKNMMVYLKNIARFKMDYFKGISYDDIRLMFENYFNSNVAFLEKSKEELEEEESKALKRKTKSSDEKAVKKQKLNEEVEELKNHLQIVPNDDDDVYTEATPLALKVSVVDYEIYSENNKPYCKIIRADGSHQLFLRFFSLLSNFDREDLDMLWQMVQERFASSKPKNFLDDFLLTTLKYIFEKPDVEAQV